MDFTARDVPHWRRELIDWYHQQGDNWFHTMIILGRQQIRPNGPPHQVAKFLAKREQDCLTQADLWFVDGDTCDLVNAAHETMPPFAPLASDLPSRYGFALFSRPIMSRDPVKDTNISDVLKNLSLISHPHDAQIINQVQATMTASGQSAADVIDAMANVAGGDNPAEIERVRQKLSKICNVDLHDAHEKLLKQQIDIEGVSWSPVPFSHDPRFPAGGIWMSFYSSSDLSQVVHDEVELARVRRVMPGLMIDNEAVVPWYPGEGDRQPFLLPADTSTTYGWARLMFATFRLGGQSGLCEKVGQRTERPERRRTERAGLPARDVTVVRLRGSDRRDSSAVAGTGVRHGHRYPVRGHWRNHWYPSVQDHRPIWIDQHIRGPEGTELHGGDRVTVV